MVLFVLLLLSQRKRLEAIQKLIKGYDFSP